MGSLQILRQALLPDQLPLIFSSRLFTSERPAFLYTFVTAQPNLQRNERCTGKVNLVVHVPEEGLFVSLIQTG